MDLDTIQGGGGGILGAVVRPALTVLALGWRAAWQGRRLLYATGLKRTRRLPVPVICVGNIVAGGTGKTPFVAWLAARLLDAGHRPGLLSRGYGTRPPTVRPHSDEAVVLRELLGERVPHHECPSRYAGGTRLLGQHPETDVLLLDDGFQHWALGRDLDVVLLDATNPFGHGRLLPRGMLREPKRALARAGVLVLTRTERGGDLDAIETEIRRYTDAPVATARTRPISLVRSGGIEPLETLRGKAVGVVCGIGNPRAFAAMVEEDLGATIAYRHFLVDHAHPDPDAWTAILDEARRAGSEFIVITRKDAVKHDALPEDVVVLDIGVDVVEGEEALWAAVERVVSRDRA